jgi:hypothetical protein
MEGLTVAHTILLAVVAVQALVVGTVILEVGLVATAETGLLLLIRLFTLVVVVDQL